MAAANVVAESPSDAVRFSSVILRAVECSLLLLLLRLEIYHCVQLNAALLSSA